MSNYLILVNTENPLPSDFAPVLSQTACPGGKIISGEPRAISSLFTMLYFADMDGITDITVESGYRSYAKQQQLFCARDQLPPYTVLPPGASEHQTGLAFDLASPKYKELVPEFDSTKEFAWLIRNAHRFGFILRYPKDKELITKVVFEPWHFRYVGEAAALDLYTKQICLEEYV